MVRMNIKMRFCPIVEIFLSTIRNKYYVPHWLNFQPPARPLLYIRDDDVNDEDGGDGQGGSNKSKLAAVIISKPRIIPWITMPIHFDRFAKRTPLNKEQKSNIHRELRNRVTFTYLFNMSVLCGII